MTVVFLDIDSVLNHSPVGDCYEGGECGFVDERTPISKDNLFALEYIVENTNNNRFVWSTSWAMEKEETWNGWNNPRLYIERLPWMKDMIIGSTPRKMSSERHEEIHFWLYENEYNLKMRRGVHYDITNFAILDDEKYGMERYGDHYFNCQWSTGLTVEQGKRVVEYLKKNDYRKDDWFRC